MDFVSDRLVGGERFGLLTLEQFSKPSSAMVAD